MASSTLEAIESEYSLPPSETNVELPEVSQEYLDDWKTYLQLGITDGSDPDVASLHTAISGSFDDTESLASPQLDEELLGEVLEVLERLSNQSVDGDEDDVTLSSDEDTQDSDVELIEIPIRQMTRAERCAATLNAIEQRLAEAAEINAANEAAWANLPADEPGSLLTNVFGALIRLPFNVLRTTIVGVWRFNLLLLRIPLIPFYLLKLSFNGIANLFPQTVTPSPPDLQEALPQDLQPQAELPFDEAAPPTSSSGYNHFSNYEDRSYASLSEYSLSPSEANVTFNDDTATLNLNDSHRDNLLDLSPDSLLTYFYNPPTYVLEEDPLRVDCDIGNPPPLYSLHERQGFADEMYF